MNSGLWSYLVCALFFVLYLHIVASLECHYSSNFLTAFFANQEPLKAGIPIQHLETFGDVVHVKDTPVNCTDMESDFCYKIVLTGGMNATLRFVVVWLFPKLASFSTVRERLFVSELAFEISESVPDFFC